jgi:hypothetical protein
LRAIAVEGIRKAPSTNRPSVQRNSKSQWEKSGALMPWCQRQAWIAM